MSSRVTYFLAVCFTVQVFALVATFFVMDSIYENEQEEILIESIASIDKSSLEEIILHAEIKNEKALDYTLYDILQTKNLREVEFLRGKVRPESEGMACDARSGGVIVCLSSNKNEIKGYLPIYSGEERIGYLLQSTSAKINPSSLTGFYEVSFIVVLLTFLLNTIAIYLYFKFDFSKEITKLANAIQKLQAKGEKNSLTFRTKEFDDLNKVFSETFDKLKKHEKARMKEEKSHLMNKIASQVAHDIRSPLAALNMISKDIDSLPETTRLMLRSSVNRIQDIANNLLHVRKTGDDEIEENISTYLLAPVIEDIVSEKRTSLRGKSNVSIDSCGDNSYGIFVEIEKSHMKRIVSNLVNNSVEAFEGEKGEINIYFRREHKTVSIVVSDNGKGIPASIIGKLGKEGATFGKDNESESGSGLGLFHAKEMIEEWGGSLKIDSKVGIGTDIIISLPIQKSPSWFIPRILLNTNQKIVIIDDDSSIHQVWETRLRGSANKKNIEIIHFTDPNEFKKWSNSNDIENVTFLCDYEFIGHKINGLNLIEENKIERNSILVTSRYEEDEIRSRCEKFGVKLIPKMMAEIVPIEARGPAEVDLVHIDDDELMRMSWEFNAKKAGKKIMSLKDPEGVREKLKEIPKETLFYIDSYLGENVISGQELAKELFEMGYENLYMSTGYEANNFDNMPWIKGVIGKEAPWGNEKNPQA
jgi:signal transduction histidine kinase